MSFTDTYGFDPYSTDFSFPDFTGGQEFDFYTPEVNPFDNNIGLGQFGFGQGGAATQGNGGFFGDITAGGLLKGLAPIGASLIGGNLANQAAQNYGQSSAAAAAITAMANQRAQEQQFGFGLKGLDKQASLRIQDANQQLAMQNSAPFRNIQTRRGAMAIGGSGVPTANALAGRYQMMFA
jgi:hypothetical protein